MPAHTTCVVVEDDGEDLAADVANFDVGVLERPLYRVEHTTVDKRAEERYAHRELDVLPHRAELMQEQECDRFPLVSLFVSLVLVGFRGVYRHFCSIRGQNRRCLGLEYAEEFV